MRKIFSILVIVFAVTLLVGCKSSSSVVATINDLTYEVKEASFTLKIEDEKGEITGDISIRLLVTSSGSEISTRTTKLAMMDQGEEAFDYGSLSASTGYTIQVSATIGRKTEILATATFTTKDEDNVITTAEEFLAMEQNRTGNFELGNDIDFTGVTFTIPFRSTTNPFAGTFEGNGYTLSNITFTLMDTYTGVFGYVSTGQISNVILDNVTIGTESNPLEITKASRVGFVAGYVSTSTAVIENVTVRNSEMNFSASTAIYTYVGGIAGENNQARIENIELDQVDMTVKTISYGRVKFGGAVGLMNDPATLKNVKSNANLNYSIEGNNLLNRTLQMVIGGIVGDYNAANTNKAIQNVYSTGDINVDLDFGTAEGTTNMNYTVNVGGIIGIAYSNISGAFYAGSILVHHEKNDYETDVNKTFNVGGLFGFYGSTRTSDQMVRLGDGQTININVSDDVNVRTSQTIGHKDSTASLNIGIYGDLHLMINEVSQTLNDTSVVYPDLNDYFVSEWMIEAYDALIG